MDTNLALALIKHCRIIARSFKDLPPWTLLNDIDLSKLKVGPRQLLEARRTSTRRQTAEALHLSVLQVKEQEQIALKRLERLYERISKS